MDYLGKGEMLTNRDVNGCLITADPDELRASRNGELVDGFGRVRFFWSGLEEADELLVGVATVLSGDQQVVVREGGGETAFQMRLLIRLVGGFLLAYLYRAH